MLNQVSRRGERKLTDDPEASQSGLSNMTESEEKDQIVTAAEQKWKRCEGEISQELEEDTVTSNNSNSNIPGLIHFISI